MHIYSTATSLLVRTLPIGSGTISSYTLSRSDPNRVYVATSAGLIILWDWDKDKKISRWDLGSSIRGITAVVLEGSPHDVIYTQETGDRYMIMAHRLQSGAEASQTKLKQILKSKEPIQSFQVLSKGTLVVVVLNTSIMIGKVTKSVSPSLEDLNYTWREFKVRQPITCFNACVRSRGHAATAKAHKSPSQVVAESLDLAIGCVEGEIFVFEDILGKLMKAENPRKAPEQPGDLTPMRLHWHREAVGSVKWSLGGMEQLYTTYDNFRLTCYRQLHNLRWKGNRSLDVATRNWETTNTTSSYVCDRQSHSVSVRHFLCRPSCR